MHFFGLGTCTLVKNLRTPSSVVRWEWTLPPAPTLPSPLGTEDLMVALGLLNPQPCSASVYFSLQEEGRACAEGRRERGGEG